MPFPVTGEVTFAIALLLIDIIEDCNLHVKTSLPVALLRVDKNLSQVTAPVGNQESLLELCQTWSRTT